MIPKFFPAFLVLALGLTVTTHAQIPSYKEMMADPHYNVYEVCAAADKYFENHDKGKGSGWKNYQRWKYINESRYYPSGDRTHVSLNFAAEQFKRFKAQNHSSHRAVHTGKWVELGPFDADNITTNYNPGIGRIETFWINPLDTQRMYLGSRSGGFWKTSDGGGTWKNTTDTLISSGVNAITVSPTNPDSIIINVRNAVNETTHGLFRSIDGGETWTITDFNASNLSWIGLGNIDRVYTVKYHPLVPDLVFIGTSEGLFRSDDNLKTWTLEIPWAFITSIEFHPTDPNIIYAYDDLYTKNNILRSTDMGLNFTPAQNIPLNDGHTMHISTTPASPNNVYIASDYGIWKSNDEGQTFTFLYNPSGNCDGFVVSDIDSMDMIYGALDILATSDGGKYFFQVTKWYTNNPGSNYVHADLRAAQCIDGVYYVGTDGYLAKSEDNGITWSRLNNGTAVREFYAADVSQGAYDVFMAGSQDNGTSILISNGWLEWGGADGMEAVVHPLNRDWMMGSWQFGGRNITKDGGQTRIVAGAPDAGVSYWKAPLILDHFNQMSIYHFSNTIYKSDLWSDTWTEIYTPFSWGLINTAAIAYNNPYIMAVSRGITVKVTKDGWNTEEIVIGSGSSSVSDITFDPNDDSTFICVYNKYSNDGHKVVITHDLGQTWDNITYNLGDMPILSVIVDQSGYIYLGAEIGVYVKKIGDTKWELYNNGLPNCSVNDLAIHHGSNTLNAITWGRGLWQINLKGKKDYPAITHTSITNPPTELYPKAGDDQDVTSIISYDNNIQKAYVLWSNDTRELDNKISMTNTQDSTWVTDIPIKNFGEGTNIYFKVVAIGINSDTSETYIFHYKVQEGLDITSVADIEAHSNIKLFPNPNGGSFKLELLNFEGEKEIDVIDASGKVVYQETNSSNELVLNLNLPKGNYFLQVKNKVKNESIQFVIN